MSFLSAQEIADMVVRLKLKVMPLTKKGVIDFIKREGWMDLPSNLCRKRTGRGGGFEYHISLLPDAVQQALHAEATREVVLANQEAKKAQEIARREKISTANLSARQRDVLNARSAILSAIEMHRIVLGVSLRQAIQFFLADPAALDIGEAVMMTANDRASGKATVSRATIYEWFKLRDASGLGALAPLPTKEKQDVPSWFWQFLRFYAQPTKPCLTDALENYCKALPSHVMPPNYDQVRRLMARLGNVEKHRGREGSLTLKSRMAFTMRSTADLLPGCVYTADGKTFDAEIAHPIHGQPFRPEITSIVDVATRRCVGLASDIRAGLVELATIAEAKAGKDTSRAVTPAGLAAAIAEAITTLVNGSPAAMDTLRELADALGNDANFAASVTNALTGKVDLTRTATDTRTGIVELATPAEAKAGTDKERAVTPEGLAATLSSIVPPRPNLCPNGGFEDGIANIAVTKSGSGTWPSAISTNSWGRSLYLTGTKTDGTYLISWPSFPVDAGVKESGMTLRSGQLRTAPNQELRI